MAQTATSGYEFGVRLLAFIGGNAIEAAAILLGKLVTVTVLIGPFLSTLDDYQLTPTTIYNTDFLVAYATEFLTFLLHSIPAYIGLIVLAIIGVFMSELAKA